MLTTPHLRTQKTDSTIELSDSVAIVTGASGEIGSAIASMFLARGTNVVWVGRSRARLNQRLKDLEIPLDRRFTVCADVRIEREVRRAIQVALKRFGRIDVLVNCAGVRGSTAPISQISLQEWQKVLETNLTGAFLFSRECLKYMASRRRGRIISISTVVSRWGYPLRAAYTASKAALNSLTLTLAQEAGEVNVQVNAVCPGPVAGKALDSVIESRAKALGLSARKMREQFMKPAALRRAVTVEDVAQAVLFLCLDAARNITGQLIDVSAGYGIWPGT